MAAIYIKWPKTIRTFSIQRPSKIYPNWDLSFENLATLEGSRFHRVKSRSEVLLVASEFPLSSSWIFSDRIILILLNNVETCRNSHNCTKQGCQMFLGTIYQNGKKYTKRPQNVPTGHKIYHSAVKYTKWPFKTPTTSIAKPAKIYANRNFWF
jgi:hypothetical protein